MTEENETRITGELWLDDKNVNDYLVESSGGSSSLLPTLERPVFSMQEGNKYETVYPTKEGIEVDAVGYMKYRHVGDEYWTVSFPTQEIQDLNMADESELMPCASPIFLQMKDVVYGNGVFVAHYREKRFYYDEDYNESVLDDVNKIIWTLVSSDGITWKKVILARYEDFENDVGSLDTIEDFYSNCKFFNGYFIILYEIEDENLTVYIYMQYSTDGVNWSNPTCVIKNDYLSLDTDYGNNPLIYFKYANGKYIIHSNIDVVDGEMSGSQFWWSIPEQSSLPSTSWSQIDTNIFRCPIMIDEDKNKFYAVYYQGSEYNEDENYILYIDIMESSDLIDWTSTSIQLSTIDAVSYYYKYKDVWVFGSSDRAPDYHLITSNFKNFIVNEFWFGGHSVSWTMDVGEYKTYVNIYDDSGLANINFKPEGIDTPMNELINNIKYPIGSVYKTVINQTPTNTLGFGEWNSYGKITNTEGDIYLFVRVN